MGRSYAASVHWDPRAPVAQGIERAPPEREVGGSNPPGRMRARQDARPGAPTRRRRPRAAAGASRVDAAIRSSRVISFSRSACDDASASSTRRRSARMSAAASAGAPRRGRISARRLRRAASSSTRAASSSSRWLTPRERIELRQRTIVLSEVKSDPLDRHPGALQLSLDPAGSGRCAGGADRDEAGVLDARASSSSRSSISLREASAAAAVAPARRATAAARPVDARREGLQRRPRRSSSRATARSTSRDPGWVGAEASVGPSPVDPGSASSVEVGHEVRGRGSDRELVARAGKLGPHGGEVVPSWSIRSSGSGVGGWRARRGRAARSSSELVDAPVRLGGGARRAPRGQRRARLGRCRARRRAGRRARPARA